jgi:hypothetical protein
MHVELHVTSRQIGWSFILQLAWVVAALSVLLVGLGACIPGEPSCFEAGNVMSELMLCLSFPSSVFFFAATAFSGWDATHSPGNYFEVWLGAFLLGYVQWFVLAPRIFGRSHVTTLGLDRIETRSEGFNPTPEKASPPFARSSIRPL